MCVLTERSSDDIDAKLWKAKSVLQGQALASSRVYQAHSSLQKEKERLECENARITNMKVSSEKEVVQLESERRIEQKQLNKAIIEVQKKVKQANTTLQQREEKIKQNKMEQELLKRRLQDVENENIELRVQMKQVNNKCEEIQKNATSKTEKAQSEVKRLKEERAMIEQKLHQQQATQESNIFFAQEQGYDEQMPEKVCDIGIVLCYLCRA